MSSFVQRLISGERDAVLLAATAYFALVGVFAVIHMIRMSRWPSVIGELHEEKIGRTGIGAFSPDEREYEAVVNYSYHVDGVRYKNDRLNPWLVSATHNLRALLKLQFRGIDRQGGSKVTVFYHPRKPQKSYLDVPGWPSIVVVAGLCFGSAVLIFAAI